MAAPTAGRGLLRCLHGHLLQIQHGLRVATHKSVFNSMPVLTSVLYSRFFSADSQSSSSSSDSESSSDSDSDSEKVKSAEDVLAKAKKPPGYMAWKPVDDVYMLRHYPPRTFTLDEALERLRKKDEWAWCRKPHKYKDRKVQLSVSLDMAMEKKKKVELFQGIVMLPHRFLEDKKVLCFAKGADLDIAKEHGAEIVGGSELVPDVLNRKFKQIDCYVATPDVIKDIVPLKAKLRKKFPNSKRKSIGRDIAGMLELYKKGQIYKCQRTYVNVLVGRLSQPNEHIAENIKTMIEAICSHKPLKYGPFITKALLTAFLLDSHRIHYEHWLPVEQEEVYDDAELDL